MATKTINVSLPDELEASIEARVRSGLYGDAEEVIRAGLRALAREEMGASVRQFEEIMSALPQEPITPEIEQDIERRIRGARKQETAQGHK